MFEKIGRLAEEAANKAATNVSVSRRGFLGRLGKAALAVAGALAFASSASAGRARLVCCKYQSYGGVWVHGCFLDKCPSYAHKVRFMCRPY